MLQCGVPALTARAGQRYEPALVAVGADAVVLDLGRPLPGAAQTTIAASFNNYDNCQAALNRQC